MTNFISPNLTVLIVLSMALFFNSSISAQTNSCDEGWEDLRIRQGGIAPNDGTVTGEGEYAGYNADLAPFYHGVASGDPTTTSVILWTRVTPEVALEYATGDIDVSWYIADTPDFTNILDQGTFTTNIERDFTVKVTAGQYKNDNGTVIEADGTNVDLPSDSWLYYIFSAQGKWSIIGRTKTVPTANQLAARTDDPNHFRLGVVSCSNLAEGYFNAYDALANRNDIEAVYHLGDYIYEYEDGHYGTFRGYAPPYEMVALDDYRSRYSIYRLEPELRKLHQYYPFVTTWDDHESTNDSWLDGAENHQPNDPYKTAYDASATEGDWTTRKGNSKQAYNEWMPIRMEEGQSSTTAAEDLSLYRKFSYGNLADIYFLDTRLEGRQVPASQTSTNVADPDNRNNPDRELLGSAQYNWLTTNMQNSTAQWQVLAQQIMFANFDDISSALPGLSGTAAAASLVAINLDQWDGFAAERQKLINFWEDNSIDNIVVLTGDIHTSWANNIPNGTSVYTNNLTGVGAPCSGSTGVEFVVTSVTSPGLDGTDVAVRAANATQNPHMQYMEMTDHGFMVFDVTDTQVQADWFYVNTLTDRNYSILTGNVNGIDKEVSFFAENGEPCLQAASGRATFDANRYPALNLITETPPTTVANLTVTDNSDLVSNCEVVGNLSVELTQWSGKNIGKINVLNWATATERNASHFILERSADKDNFTTIAKVDAKGNSATEINYAWEDNAPLNGMNYYRLTQVDQDGTTVIYNTLALKSYQRFEQHYIAPNPAYDFTNLMFYSEQAEPVRLQIMDGHGQVLKTLETNTIEGNNTFQVDLSGLAPGPYMIGIHHLNSKILGSAMVVKMK